MTGFNKMLHSSKLTFLSITIIHTIIDMKILLKFFINLSLANII